MHKTRHFRARRLIALLIGALLALSAGPVRAQDGGAPASARLNGLRHVYQTWNNCSGANLTMAMSYFGWGYDQDYARRWLKPNVEDKNVSPAQMAAFVNQQTEIPNLRAIWRYGGTIDLVRRLTAAGFPVIAESGFDVEDLGWMGHYETVAAYDDALQTIWVYDSYLGLGEGYGITHSYADFDYWWRHFNRAFIVLFTLDREQELRNVLGPYVDPVYATQTALDQARREATANPADGWAWFNMGTSFAKLGNCYDAATSFDEAFRHGLPWRLMWYMFGPYEAYFNVGRFNDVIALANNTEATTVYVEEMYYWRGLAYAALGQRDAALNQLNQAIALNRNFAEPQTAIAQIENGTFAAPAPAQ